MCEIMFKSNWFHEKLQLFQKFREIEFHFTFFVLIGIHAREWIAHAMATYMIDWLVNGDGNDILDKLNFHILPMANPDGYEYSHDTVSVFTK